MSQERAPCHPAGRGAGIGINGPTFFAGPGQDFGSFSQFAGSGRQGGAINRNRPRLPLSDGQCGPAHNLAQKGSRCTGRSLNGLDQLGVGKFLGRRCLLRW